MEDLFFHIATKLHYGIDTVSLLGIAARETGSRIMLVHDSDPTATSTVNKAVQSLEDSGISPLLFDECGSLCTSRQVEKAMELALGAKVQGVIGLGGVSTLSAAKAVAGFVKDRRFLDPLFGMSEVDSDGIPFIGVLSACRDPFMFTPRTLLVDAKNRSSHIISMKGFAPHTLFVDPVLCMHITSAQMKTIAAEILVHAIEGYLSTASNFITQSLFLRAIDIMYNALVFLTKNERDSELVAKCCQAGLLCGLGFTMGRLGLASAVAYAAHGLRQVPSSPVSTIMLPYVLEYAAKRCPDKLLRFGPILGVQVDEFDPQPSIEQIVDVARGLIGDLGLPARLSECDIQAHHLPLLASIAAEIGVLGYLPVPLSTDGILQILKQAL